MEFVTQNIQVIWALAAVLLLLVVLVAVWRAFSSRISGRRGQRLGISEYYELDKTRRLVLVRRDNVEHLVLIGGPLDLVIEHGITPAAVASAYSTAPGTPEPTPRAAPRPPVFGDRKPPPMRPAEPGAAPAAPRAREEPGL